MEDQKISLGLFFTFMMLAPYIASTLSWINISILPFCLLNFTAMYKALQSSYLQYIFYLEFPNAEIRAILKLFFVKGKSARETFREINGVVGDGTLSLRTAKEWFRRFKAGENDTLDKPTGGRPVTANTDQTMENIELDRHVASRDIAQKMGVSHQTIETICRRLDTQKSLMFGCRMICRNKNLLDRINAFDMLLKGNELDHF